MWSRYKLLPWFIWLAVFYSFWLILISADGALAAAIAHWPMAVAMAVGSYAAGSTPMGGGTVGFPVLVLLFDLPASLGRDFSFAVQSVGMVSASIFIFARRQPLAAAMLKGGIIGGLIGTPIGMFFIAPWVPELYIKLSFAVLWGSFGILHLYRINEISAHEGMIDFNERWDFNVGLVVGVLAGAFAVSVTGVGIDMMLYACLILLCRADLKIAIPSSVVVMGITSLYGSLIKTATGTWQPGVYENWLAAAPVVALGAPLGVFIVERVGRKPTLLIVAALCVGQFVWTCFVERELLQLSGLFLACVAVGACLWVFEGLRLWGNRLARGQDKDPKAHLDDVLMREEREHLASEQTAKRKLKAMRTPVV